MRPAKRNESTLGIALLIAACLGLAGCEDNSAATTPTVPATTSTGESVAKKSTLVPGENGEPDRLFIDRFMFAPPPDWTMRGVQDMEVVRIFEKGNTDSPDARITIYRRQAASPDGVANAKAYAADWGGAVLGDELVLGQTEAHFISRSHPGDGLAITDAVLCRWFHEDFIIQGESTPGEEIGSIVKEIAASWQWVGGG